jgi:UDPglucose--hexose-1-phosphate uridylyltransferase
LRLEKFIESAGILDPRSGFSESRQDVEVRIDPLTGTACRINITRTARPRQILRRTEEIVPSKCPFCPENLELETPKFTPDLIPEGRLKSGGAILFPNLFPLSDLHGVCVFTPAHKLDLDKFLKEEIHDGITCCRKFFEIVGRKGAIFHFLGWNHLSSSGASILHPHFQVMASKKPLRGPKSCFDASKRYWRREGMSFWSDLISSERGSPRYIGETTGFLWFAPWAPTGAFEVIGVSGNTKASLLQLEEREMEGLSVGIVKILSGLWSLGATSVTMALISWPSSEAADWFSMSLRLMVRPSGGISDRAFLELYGGEVGLTTLPEDYAKALRERF